MAPLPPVEDVRTLLHRLISATETLTGLVEEETHALTQSRPHAIADLIARKEREAIVYAQAARTFKALPETAKRAEPALLAQFKTVLARFDAALLRNGQLVMRLKQQQEGLLQAIAATQGRTAAPGTYGQTGRVSAPPGGGISALAVNASA
jgi:flagellar biosynthesis/type III secretory pathway chaperone